MSASVPGTSAVLRKVLIGPLDSDPAESVSAVNRAFVKGLAESYEFIPLRSNRTKGATRQSRLNLVNGWYFMEQAWQWFWHLTRRRPDVAHYAVSAGWAMEKGLFFLRLARLLGVKTVAHIHSGSFLTTWQALPAWRRRRAFRQLSHTSRVVLLSESWRTNVAREIGLPDEKLAVVNNPIDPDFEAEALKMPVDRPNNIVLSLGTMGRPKGIMDIVEAMTLLPSGLRYQIRVAGPEREPGILREVERYVAAHALSPAIELRPSVWGAEKTKLYREASIFLLPSYYENFPLVVLEAAAAGLAIVTTPVGAVPEFFEDGVSAVFIQAGKPKELAGALQRLVENQAERQRLGQAARDVFCRRLARNRIMDSLDTVYRQLLAA